MKFFSRLLVPVLMVAVIGCTSQTPNEENDESEISVDESYVNEVEELAESAEIKEAMEFIRNMDEETVQNQITITEIPAPPFQEEARAERYAEMMQEYGLDQVEIDEEGNVIGKRPGTEGEQTIVISAHLDTVFPEGTEVKVEVRNDTLFAPGITDDTRGLSALLTLINTFETLDIQTADNIWFVGTVGEEGIGDLRGVKHLFETEGDNIDAFISIDGSRASRI
ncbi:MAG: M20/M25/M40 family metallo-hydrolase, partial [Gracilimonas sp.]|uniref:M20/M25/M40 family metallo-hydrolase n=1 Tax=Gracilimonas sp. TaxID=1974203 RepID=UPI003751FBCB|nr:M20/M25/M40 family metallo-hydrolase [Gracilimonas sp.]